ncbi:MAG: hypothetical protein B7Z69_04890 [Actinobacteria bacterium 21-73-9]|nr:MAG: hypothetical protein B7Z69_04890 [Actinobacteria bacterium 21-73-9]
MAVTVNLVHEGVGNELRRGPFGVEGDGDRLGTIDWHGAAEFAVTPRRHTLILRSGRYTSRSVALDAPDGEVISLRGHGAMVLPRWLASA